MLRLPRFEHIEIKRMDELISTLDELRGEAKLIAGGTDLLPRIIHRLVHPKYVMNLKGLSRELNFIRSNENNELSIGALTTLAEIEESPLIRRGYSPLLQAVRSIGSNQIRNMGTIGGNICLETRCYYYNQSHQFQFVAPCYKRGGTLCYLTRNSKKCLAVHMADTAPVLISIGAKVNIKSREAQKLISVEEIYSGKSDSPLKIDTNEIITEIIIPPLNGLKGRYLKQTFRGSIEFGIASLALTISYSSKKRVKDACLVLGSVSARPVRAQKTEQLLKGEKITPSLIAKASEILGQEVAFYPHHGNPASYVKHVSLNLLKSGLSSLSGS